MTPLRYTSSLAGPSFPYRPAAVPVHTRWFPTGGGQVHAGLPPPPPPRPDGRVSLRQVATSGCSTSPPRQRYRPRYIGCGFREHGTVPASPKGRTPSASPQDSLTLSSLRTLNRGSGSGVSGWTNAFILDVFTSDAETRESGKDLLTALCNKMLR